MIPGWSCLVQYHADGAEVARLELVPAVGATRYYIGNLAYGEFLAIISAVDNESDGIDSNLCRTHVHIGASLVAVACLKGALLFGSDVARSHDGARVHAEQRVEGFALCGIAHQQMSIGILVFKHRHLLLEDVLEAVVAHECCRSRCRCIRFLFGMDARSGAATRCEGCRTYE